MKYVVSACLAKENCRYDGKNCKDERVEKLLKEGKAVLVCPEVAGGLGIPRVPGEIRNNRVINAEGKDVTEAFEKGALLSLETALKEGCRCAILKSRSPSCGLGKIYDGSFSGKLSEGNGIFAQLLLDQGFEVYSEETFEE